MDSIYKLTLYQSYEDLAIGIFTYNLCMINRRRILPGLLFEYSCGINSWVIEMAFEYSDFCRELLSDWDELLVDVEVCGSFSELPLLYIANNVTNTDIMMSLKDIDATSDGSRASEKNTSQWKRYYVMWIVRHLIPVSQN